MILDARLAGEVFDRSIAGQVEFWASLGKSVDSLLNADQIVRLKRLGAERKLSEILTTVDTAEGRDRLNRHLQQLPFPHYEPHPKRRDLLIRVMEDGTRTVGRFVNREFRAVRVRAKA